MWIEAFLELIVLLGFWEIGTSGIS